MNKHFFRSLVAVAALTAAVAGTASADVMWNFASLLPNSDANTNLGATVTVNTVAGGWLKAVAVAQPQWTMSSGACTSSQPCLFDKVTNSDPTETGLGLTPNNNNEIFNPNGIALTTTPNWHFTSLTMGSIQGSESWAVAGCAANYTGCMTLDSGVGSATGTVTVTNLLANPFATYVVYVPCAKLTSCSTLSGTKFTNSDNNIVLMSATTVPEPGVLALMAVGLFGLGWTMRRRRLS